MNRLCAISVLACALMATGANGEEATKEGGQDFFRAKHGFGGGLTEMLDLTEFDGFEKVRTLDDLAEFASNVPGVAGFTAHPRFESGTRYASVVVWYTGLSPSNMSWPLYLFDKTEAKKAPGDAPRTAAVDAAAAKVFGKMNLAQQLMEAGGENGVTIPGDSYQERKVVALAVMRLGGFFKHTGAFGAAQCNSCRSVVPGGNPRSCGLGIAKQDHWNCCGALENVQYCRYWELIKAKDEAQQGEPGER